MGLKLIPTVIALLIGSVLLFGYQIAVQYAKTWFVIAVSAIIISIAFGVFVLIRLLNKYDDSYDPQIFGSIEDQKH